MSLELYDDEVVFSLWDAQTKAIKDNVVLYDKRDHGGPSHKTQLKRMVSHWCPFCECAFREADVPFEDPPIHAKCPVCGTELEEFDLDNLAPDWEDDSWMFPDGHDDGESLDELPCDK